MLLCALQRPTGVCVACAVCVRVKYTDDKIKTHARDLERRGNMASAQGRRRHHRHADGRLRDRISACGTGTHVSTSHRGLRIA